jgi:hypothetical protein
LKTYFLADPHSHSIVPLKQLFSQIVHIDLSFTDAVSNLAYRSLTGYTVGFTQVTAVGGELFDDKSQRLQLETPIRVASINFIE